MSGRRPVIHWEKGQTEPAIHLWPAIIRFLGYDPVPPPTSFATRLVAGRRRLGLPRKLGVDDGTLGRWEQGRGNPNPRLRDTAERALTAGLDGPISDSSRGVNVWEWNEAFIGPSRGLRGGSFSSGPLSLAASLPDIGDPAIEFGNVGFRVASLPEPSTGRRAATN